MRRFLAALVAALAITTLISSAALADSPHFIKASSSIDSAGHLLCSFKEAGLGSVETATVTCTADATAVFACINGGGKHPKAANKETINTEVGGSGAFPVRNGQTTGEIVVGLPGPGGFSCPSGQNLVLASVSYTNIILTGEGASAGLPDVSRILVNI